MTSWIFDAPGNVKDFSDPTNWHKEMANEANGIVLQLVSTVLEKEVGKLTDADIQAVIPHLAYIHPLLNLPSGEETTFPLAPWGAFPRAVTRHDWSKDYAYQPDDPSGYYRAAEHLGDEDHRRGVFVDRYDRQMHLPVRDRQDEYLEWVIEVNGQGQLTKATFVAEGYDYFSSLFEHDEGRCLEIYREFVGDSSIRVDDLRAPHGVYRRLTDGSRTTVAEPGAFNPRNRFNINPGIVHLSHRANSLGAEVNLAGVSGILRSKADGTLLEGGNPEEVLCCCAGGNPNRNSDPLISQQAYKYVKDGFRYTLANPVGLYIAGAEHHRLQLPNGAVVPREWWTVVRGDGFGSNASRVLRLILAPPKGETLTLSDLQVDGSPVRYGGQLASLLTVHLFVTAWKREAGSQNPSTPCVATCCKQKGAVEIFISEAPCAGSTETVFRGLIGGGGAGAGLASPASNQASPASIISGSGLRR